MADIFHTIFPKKPEYGVKSVTMKGVSVKSKAEKIISDYLTKNDIDYEYEPKSFRFALPDFYLPKYDVYVEYWGLVDADDSFDRDEYQRKMKRKMAQYHRNNIKFVSIYPGNIRNLDWIFRTKFREATGYELSHNAHAKETIREDIRPTPNCDKAAEPKSSICPKCRDIVPSDANFCPFCGIKFQAYL